jgi:deglycase
MANELSRTRVVFVVANEGVEHVELTDPWQAVKDAGGEPTLAAPDAGETQTMNHLQLADTFPVDLTTKELSVENFDAMVLPGGVANSDQLRMDEAAVAFAAAMFSAGKPAAVICHGPWTIVEANVVKGRTLTSWPSLKTDIRNAGGSWVDEEVVVCRNGPNVLVTSRKPDDLRAFCSSFLKEFSQFKGNG